MVQIMAFLNHFLFSPITVAINNTSGGMGKKELSRKAITKSADEAYLVFDQAIVQLYNLLRYIPGSCIIFGI